MNTALWVGSTTAEYRRRIIFLDLMANCLWCSPGQSWHSELGVQVILSFSSTNTPKSFSSGMLSIHSPPSTCTWDCPDPRTLQTLCELFLGLVELHEVCKDTPLKSQPRSLWMAFLLHTMSTAWCHQHTWRECPARVLHSIPPSMLATKMLHRSTNTLGSLLLI